MEVRKRLGTQGVAVADLILPGQKTPIVPSNRPDISNCPQARLDMATKQCKKGEGKFIPSKQCLIDVCFGGKAFAAEDVMSEGIDLQCRWQSDMRLPHLPPAGFSPFW